MEAALSYVACNSEGELLCRNNDCWCRCSTKFPDCNCPFLDIRAMEESLRKSREAWISMNNEFTESGKGSAVSGANGKSVLSEAISSREITVENI